MMPYSLHLSIAYFSLYYTQDVATGLMQQPSRYAREGEKSRPWTASSGPQSFASSLRRESHAFVFVSSGLMERRDHVI